MQGGTAVVDRLGQNGADAFQQAAAPPAAEPVGPAGGPDAGGKQNFRSVDVADSGNQFLVKQRRFDCRFSFLQALKQQLGRQQRIERVGSHGGKTGLTVDFCRRTGIDEAETAGIDKDQQPGRGFNDHVIVFFLRRGVAFDGFDPAAHAQVPNDAAAVVEINDDVFALAAVFFYFCPADGGFKAVRHNRTQPPVADRDVDDFGLAGKLGNAVFNGFDFGQFGHNSPPR